MGLFLLVNVMYEDLYRNMLKHFEPCEDLGLRRRDLLIERLGIANREPTIFHISNTMGGKRGPWNSYPLPGFVAHNHQMEVGYRTGTGNYLSLFVNGYTMPRGQIPLMSIQETVGACGTCKGSSGGCPGFASRFEWLHKHSDNVFVLTVSFDMAWTWKYNRSDRFGIVNKLSYADRLSESYTRRLLVHMSNNGAGMYLGLGNCSGCRPKCCSVSKGGICSKPDKRSFSCEATGMDCDALHIMLYGEPLQWYYKGTNLLQTYMTRYSLFFARRGIQYETLLNKAICDDKSYVQDGKETPPVLSVSVITVPRGVHAGSDLYVYGNKETS